MALNFREGNAIIAEEMKSNPDNLMAVYIANYADCLLLLFNGDKTDYNKFHYHLDTRQKLLDKGDETSPWYRLTKAALYMQWAFVYIRMGENFKAATTFRKSYILLKENKKRFPNFEYNNIFLGLEEAVTGTVPDDYRWIAGIFGLKGNVKKGVEKLQSFVRTHSDQDPFYYDAVLFLTYLRFYLMSEQEEVWKFVNSSQFPAENNLLFSFVKANIGLNYRKADDAYRVLLKMQSMKGYNSLPAMDYEMGSALAFKASPDALMHLKRFTTAYKGNLFIKDAYMKIACILYVNGNYAEAEHYRTLISKYGTTNVDADRKAQRFAEGKIWQNTTLLKTSWLIDGGHYDRALVLLGTFKESDFTTQPDIAEYNLRMGRIYDELGNDDLAIRYYNRAIYIGKEQKEYFAARAALQAAFIHERKGNVQSAINYYKQCMDMPVQDYKNAIKQQAKAGLNRLGIQ